MFTLFEPSENEIENFLAAQRDLPFSYVEVGASKNVIPAGYPINQHRVQIGNGADVFASAKIAIKNWTMYQLEWTQIYPDSVPIAVGAVVCVVVNNRLCWSINSCLIIYLIEESGGEIERYGFAFGTLPGHSEEGEERFVVEWNCTDDSVWYELLVFARPHHIFARIGFPFVGLFQRKFARDSGRVILEAVRR